MYTNSISYQKTMKRPNDRPVAACGLRDEPPEHCRAGKPSLALRCLGRQVRPAVLLWASVAAIAASVVPTPAHAHIKWFAPYDVTKPPMPVHGVLTQHFLLVFIAFTLLMAASFIADRLAAKRSWTLAESGANEALEELLVRSGTGAFFMALFAVGGIILTPELHTSDGWVAWLQLGIAASMLSARTCIVGSLGILVLYAYGISQYGVFHLSDYPVFLGLAAYLALTSFPSERLRSYRMAILYAALCVCLMWGAVEKWAYPQWTLPLLAARPYLTFGFTAPNFMIFAGFVEFAFAFYMLTGLGLLRLAILGLSTIFIAAVFDFGKVDAIGHLPILTAMAAMFVHGPTQMHVWLHAKADTAFRLGRTAGGAFVMTVFLFLAVYYGVQHAEYGHNPQDRIATSVSSGHRL
ncbi:hypothetical protein CCS01_13385 [Rhodopila globiformis]|uniref:Uncharacterized protein n=1 Tax=Rhodopila globiformis TaxID=1071 RepID=A0A2S6NGD8_RHOGL|nr:hypothetical protein CCS01_13385 [Rhodopila globiformis]